MQKEHIVETLREKGCRITKQRLMLIDIILEEECQSCKEIYYKAVKADAKIGTATVYRMVNNLEEPLPETACIRLPVPGNVK